MEYCCHVLAGDPICYLKLVDKLEKQMYRFVGSSLVASSEPLTDPQNIASLKVVSTTFFLYTWFLKSEGEHLWN